MYRKKTVLVSGLAALALAGTLTACGASGNSGTPTKAPTNVTQQVQPPSLEAVAQQVGVTGLEKDSDTQLYVREQGTASYNGQDVMVYTFNNETAKQNWKGVAVGQYGVTVFAEGPLWIVTSV